MKKKFILFGLLGAAVVAMSTLVSCNDKEEDRFLEFQKALQDPETDPIGLNDLKARVAALEGDVQKLTDAQKACAAMCKENEARIDSLETALKNVEDNYVTKTQLATTLQDYYTKEAVLVVINNLISDAKTELYTYIQNNKFGTGDGLTLDNLVDQFLALQQAESGAKALAQQALDLANQNKIAIDGLKSAVDDLTDRVELLEGRLPQVADTANAAYAKAVANEALIAALQEDNQKLWDAINNNPNFYQEFLDSIAAQQARLDALREETQQNLDSITALLREEIAAAKQEAIDETKAWVRDTLSNFYTKDEVDAAIQSVRDYFQSALDYMGPKLDSLEQEVTALKAKVDALEQKVNDLTSRVEDIEETLDNLVTSIVAQGTENPVFGSFALPAGIRSQILAAYYGRAEGYVEFPTDNELFFADGDDSYTLVEGVDFSGVEPIKIQSGSILVSDNAEAGNAGTLYFTVNGTYTDLDKVSFSLVTSRDDEAAIKLGDIKESEKELNFGFGRAGNNFFEAAATLDKTEEAIAAAKVKIDLNDIKEVAKDILSYRDGINVTNAVTTLYHTLQDIMPAYAVKATWTDGKGTDHNVYSQYALAATAVHGLSYNFAKAYDRTTVPGLGRIEDLVNTIIDRLHIDGLLNDIFGALDKIAGAAAGIDLSNWSIRIPELTEDLLAQFVITVESKAWIYVAVDDDSNTIVYARDSWDAFLACAEQNGFLDYALENYSPDVPTMTFTATRDIRDAILEMYGNIDDAVANLEDLKSDLEDFFNSLEVSLDDLASLRDRLSIDKVKDNISSLLEKYINAINKRFGKFFSPNAYLQPILLVQTGNGFARLSNLSTAPTHVSAGDLVVTPTSYTNEIFAPAVMRYMQVRKDGQKVQEFMLEGTAQEFPAVSVTAGNYEIIYEALDFSGKVVAKKAYVTVK